MKKNLKNHIEEKLRKKKLKTLVSFFLFIISFNANSLEIIRDPIAEDYFFNLSKNDGDFHSYIVFDSKPNAFVIEDSIYFTTELIKLIEDEGFDPKSDDYYNELDQRMRDEFPNKLGEQTQSSKRPAQTVASASRTSTGGRGKKVKLTPSQVTIAKRLGVPLEEYAKYVRS